MTNLLSLNSYHYRRGGADAVYFEHDALFSRLGWDTASFSMQHPSNEPSRWDKFFVDEIQYGHSYGMARKLCSAVKVIYSAEARKKLSALLDIFSPDVAHAHNLYHHISPSVLPLLKSRGIPVVMTAHDLKLACPAHTMLNDTGICERCKGGNFLHTVRHRCVHGSISVSSLVAVESAVHKATGIYANNLDRIVAPSRFYLEKFVEWGWPREQLAYIPNYVDPIRFEPTFGPGDYFVYFGRLSAEKGLRTLLRAAESGSFKLVLMGDGDLKPEILAAAERSPSISYLGRRTGAELCEIVAGARATILPSEWYENAPLSVLESYCLGKPVIGARIGGIPELIMDGDTGWLFEPGSSESLVESMRRVQNMADSDVAEIGRRARDFSDSHFTPARYVDDMLALYSSIGVSLKSHKDASV